MPAQNNQQFTEGKDAYEDAHSEKIKEKGGEILLCNSHPNEHFDRYGHILRPQSPFVFVEMDDDIYKTLSAKAYALKCKHPEILIRTIHGNIFTDVFDKFPKKPRVSKKTGKPVPLFRYIHLDFCITAFGLQRDGFHTFLFELARWAQLKSPFYMTLTVCLRRDKGSAETLIKQVIPTTFKQAGWSKVRRLQNNNYGNKPTMRTVLIKFTK